ncbi:MAG: hypothetical protein AMXMBFR22_28360 [Phycisphaerae bacterium]
MPAALAQVPDGFELLQITSDAHYDSTARLNECGQLVFAKRIGHSWADTEVILYDNGVLSRITVNDDRDVLPDINNNGVMTWCRGIEGAGATQIIVYEDGVETLVAENPVAATGPTINNQEHLGWTEWWGTGCEDSDADIALRRNHRVRMVSDGTNTNQAAALNNVGMCTWTDYDFCPEPWESRVWYYDNGVARVISQDWMHQPQVPTINDSGTIVWMATDISEGELWIWRDGVTERLTDWGSNPRINNRGDIVMRRSYEGLRGPHVWLYRDGEFLQITDGPNKHWVPDINDHGEIVLRMDYTAQSTDILFMRRIRTGEFDFDGDFDLVDHREWTACLDGPDFLARHRVDPTDTLCDCRFLDLDHDNDVDLKDFSGFQNTFSKP